MANQLIGRLSVSGGPAPVLDTLNVTTNGTYTPPTGTDGYNEVNVNVPSSTPVLDTLSVTANGTYTPPTGTDGYNVVNVRVSSHNYLADGKSVLFLDSTHGLVVSFYSENVNSVENLSSHYNDPKFYNIFKDRQVWCKVYEDVDATAPLGYIGFYQNTIRAWDLSLSQNINIEGAYGSIVLSDDTQQQDNNGVILF